MEKKLIALQNKYMYYKIYICIIYIYIKKCIIYYKIEKIIKQNNKKIGQRERAKVLSQNVKIPKSVNLY